MFAPRFARAALACAAVSFASAALAYNVAVRSDEEPGAFVTALEGGGNTATIISESQLEAGILGYDVLVIGHIESFSSAACTAIQNFLNAGKGVVTEWNGVYNMFDSTGPNVVGNISPQCGFFTGTVDWGSEVGTNTPVDVTNAGSPLVTGLPNPIELGGGSEFFFKVTGYDGGLWSVAATYDGNGGTGNAAIMTAKYNNAGNVVVGVFDYGDVLGSDATANTMVNNFVAVAANGAPVTPPPIGFVDVPALSDAALAGLAMLLLGAGSLVLRRRG